MKGIRSVQPSVVLGLRENAGQFALLVLVNAFVGAMVGLERAVLPLIGEESFDVASRVAILSFVAAFGLAKALANLAAGHFSDRIGRRRVLVAGWLVGIPVPVMIIFAPSWGWIVAANVLLGVNQGLAWSATVIMKIDLVGPRQRGLAMGLNEAAGYVAVALAAAGSGYLATAYGLRPAPFMAGLVIAVLGLLVTVLFVRDTRAYAALEASGTTDAAHPPDPSPTPSIDPADPSSPNSPGDLSFHRVLLLTSWKNRSLFAVSQTGMVNNLNDGMAWGLFPLVFAARGFSIETIALLAGLYPVVWGLGQLGTGAWSDRTGRKPLIVAGMLVQAAGIGLLAASDGPGAAWTGMALLGAGTALVYPTLLAAVGDEAHPTWRATSVGVYRLWRDGGYVVGALVAGLLADWLGVEAAIAGVGALTALSAMVTAAVMRETRREGGSPSAGGTT